MKRAGLLAAIGCRGGGACADGCARGRGRLRRRQLGSRHLQDRTLPECTYASPKAQFFTQAAGHPPVGLTDFVFNTGGLLGAPEGNVKDVRVDLPEGLNVDPQAVPQCPKADFEANPASCAASEVGTSIVTSTSSVLPLPLTFPVYNLVPDNGSPALFGFNANVPLLLDADVYLVADVAWDSDYHEGFTITRSPQRTGAAGREPARLRRHQRRHAS